MPTIVDDHHPHLKSDHECTVPTKKAARAVPTKKVAQVSVSTKKAAQVIPTKNSTQVNNNAAVPSAVTNVKRYKSKRHQREAETKAYFHQQNDKKKVSAKQIKEIAILESLKTVRSGRMKRSTRSTGQTAAREPSFCTRRRTSRAAVRAINNVQRDEERDERDEERDERDKER